MKRIKMVKNSFLTAEISRFFNFLFVSRFWKWKLRFSIDWELLVRIGYCKKVAQFGKTRKSLIDNNVWWCIKSTYEPVKRWISRSKRALWTKWFPSWSLFSVIFAVWNAFHEFGLQHSHNGRNDIDFASSFCRHQIKQQSNCQ